MYWLMRALGFIGMSLLGWAGIFVVYAIGLTIVGHLPADQRLYDFKIAFFGYGVLACIIGIFLGLPSFFKQGGTRLFFLALPCLLPVLYCTGVMIYFAVNG
jgi:hypothetical protein